jgi:UDP-N-acetylmuramoyl-tripeptide--D-alanyl-D-alanine ligase
MTGDLIKLVLTDLLFLLLVTNAAVYYTHFWQLKEYRMDRMVDFLKTATGKKRILTWLFISKTVLATALVMVYATFYLHMMVSGAARGSFLTGFWTGFLPMIFVLALAETADLLIRLFRRRFYRPEPTAKAGLIVLLTILLAVAWPLFHWHDLSISARTVAIKWGVVYLFAPLLNSLIVLFFTPITLLSKSLILKRAKRKIMTIEELKVVAITGSYGKSSTKEFLSHLLSTRFNVIKTPGNTNTEIGVARLILKKLAPDHNVFIVEAGAYKMGEIRKIAEMITPQIAIITAVKDSHLSLFGSLENIKRGKFELVQGLNEQGVAIFNTDNEGSADLAQRARNLKLGKIVTFGLAGGSSLTARDITEDKDGVTFSIEGVRFALPVPGKHNVYNFLAAVAAARELGLGLEEMAELAGSVKMREHTLSVLKPSKDLVLLDDTYNANPDGVMAALDYLSLYKDWQKVIVFPGMLELGERSAAEHARVVKRITEVCDQAIFISEDSRSIIEQVLKKERYDSFQYIIANPQKLARQLEQLISRGKTVILFISRGSEQVLKKLANR